MNKKLYPYCEIVVRFTNGTLTPIERLHQIQAITSAMKLTEEFETVEVEIGQHTGPCSPAFCDQSEEGFHS